MSGKKRRCRHKRRGHAKYIVVLLLLLCGALLLGGVAAKYVREDYGKNVFAAKDFYFSSNLLTTDEAEYRLNAGTESVTFTLGNNADELRYAQDNIKYTVTIDNGASVSTPAGTLETGGVSTATITINGLKNGVTYTVTAVGEAGYKATLSASFTVSGNDENIYKHLNTSNRDYILLTVWTDNLKGDVKVDFPAGVIPDNTDPIMREVKNYGESGYGSGDFTDAVNFVETYSSYTYRFFVKNSENISVNDFKVSIIDDSKNPVVEHLANEATPR